MSKIQVVSELWQFMRKNKKYWLAPIVITLVGGGSTARVGEGISHCALHLYTVLKREGVTGGKHSWCIGLLSRFRGLSRCRWRDRGGGAGRTLHTDQARSQFSG